MKADAQQGVSEDEQGLLNNQDIQRSNPGLTRMKSEVSLELRKQWKEQSREFLEWIEGQENLDVYQVASVLYQTRGLANFETLKALLKVIVCVSLQVVGMVYLCIFFMFLQDSDEEEMGLTGFDKYCRRDLDPEGNDDTPLKILAIFFAAWISLVLADQMVDVATYGLYSFGTAQPPFVNNFIIYLGLIANFFVSLVCWLTSIWLMYFSDNIIDLILNGLAIYFMKTIDDEMVFGHDYQMINDWFLEKVQSDTDEILNADEWDKTKPSKQYEKFVDDYIAQLDATEDVNERDGCCYYDCCHGPCIENPVKCWCILSPLVIIAPLYLSVCY